MKIRKAVKRLLVKLTLFLVVLLAAGIPSTAAFFSDIEVSEGNTFVASGLDMVFSSETSDFVGDNLTPGNIATRSGVIQNVGVLPFKNSQEYEYVSGDADLCAALVLQVWDETSSLVYSGALTSFFYSPVAALLASDLEGYDYQVTLPVDASSTLRNKTCSFNILAKAWQVGWVFGSGFWDEEVLANTISTGAWPPPAPNLVSPADGTAAGVGSDWMNNPVMDWSDVSWGETVTYIYQSSLSNAVNPDGSFVTPAYTSAPLVASEIPAPGTPDGIYYWHVQTCDTTWGCGEWSEMWMLTVDRTIQEANSGDVIINEIMWMGSDGGPNDEWIELKNMTASPVILKDWVIENAGSGPGSITLSGTIPASGYFLISHFTSSASAISDAISVDLVIPSISLVNVGEQLTLKDAFENTIDQTPVTDGDWAAGINDNPTPLKQSMERNDTPGNGTNDSDWHTCLDAACNDATYWDTADGPNYGTPKAQNLSENDPTNEPPLAEATEGQGSENEVEDPVEGVVEGVEETESEVDEPSEEDLPEETSEQTPATETEEPQESSSEEEVPPEEPEESGQEEPEEDAPEAEVEEVGEEEESEETNEEV